MLLRVTNRLGQSRLLKKECKREGSRREGRRVAASSLSSPSHLSLPFEPLLPNLPPFNPTQSPHSSLRPAPLPPTVADFPSSLLPSCSFPLSPQCARLRHLLPPLPPPPFRQLLPFLPPSSLFRIPRNRKRSLSLSTHRTFGLYHLLFSLSLPPRPSTTVSLFFLAFTSLSLVGLKKTTEQPAQGRIRSPSLLLNTNFLDGLLSKTGQSILAFLLDRQKQELVCHTAASRSRSSHRRGGQNEGGQGPRETLLNFEKLTFRSFRTVRSFLSIS